MIEWLQDFYYRVWYPLPRWLKWAIVIWLVFSIDAVRMAWTEHRFVGGYFEALVAEFIYIGIPLFAFAFGLLGGVKAYEKSKSKIIGWAVGIALAVAIFFVQVGAERIPGVGWRIHAMQEAHDLANELN